MKPGTNTAEPWIGADSEPTLGVLRSFRGQPIAAPCGRAFPPFRARLQAPSALVAFDLKKAKLKGRYPLPTAGAFCNDIAVGADGAIYVTDSANMEIDRLAGPSAAFQTWAGNGGFGPKGGVIDGISVIANRVFVNTLETNKTLCRRAHRRGWRRGRRSAETSSAGQSTAPMACEAMERDSCSSKAADLARLAQLTIDGNSGSLVTFKEGLPGGPVSVAVVGTTAYVLEGQLKGLFGPPDPKFVAKPTSCGRGQSR